MKQTAQVFRLFLICLTGIFLISLVSADLISIGTGDDGISLGYNNQMELFFTDSNPPSSSIPEDIEGFLLTSAKKITPSNEKLGKWIILISIFVIIFYKDINELIKKVKLKQKW